MKSQQKSFQYLSDVRPRFADGLAALIPLAVLFTLTGCGNGQAAQSHRKVQRLAAGPYVPPTSNPFTQPAGGDEPDPLIVGGDTLAGDGTDPLAKDRDPLEDSDSSLASTTKQDRPQKYSDHFHWLRGNISDAQVTVSLNGILLGEYSTSVDKDITMKLHDGMNTVTFVYRSLDPSGMAHLDIVESEHHPPIPPLATFQATGDSTAGTESTTSQTFTFYSRNRFTGV